MPALFGLPDWRVAAGCQVLLLLAAGVIPAWAAWAGTPIEVVAAENFYGDVAQQIGGDQVSVSSILNNPNQDPHFFEVSPSVARSVSTARVVVYNGIGYDPWMDTLLRTVRSPRRQAVVVAPLSGRREGDNPHVWYDLDTMLDYARALTEALAAQAPGQAPGFRLRLDEFRRSVAPVQARIAAMRARLAGMEATATEPVFGYMLAALGIPSRNARFQLAVMNGAEPSASDVAAFEDDLRRHLVAFLVYNSQASAPLADRMRALAERSGVPVLGVTETEPAGLSYQAWIMQELDALDRALAR